jgi:hypothetical protein
MTGHNNQNIKENFGINLDSMPDTWSRTLMKGRVFQEASVIVEVARAFYEIDYLLGVYNESYMLYNGFNYRDKVIDKLINNLIEFVAKKRNSKKKNIFITAASDVEVLVMPKLMKKGSI